MGRVCLATDGPAAVREQVAQSRQEGGGRGAQPAYRPAPGTLDDDRGVGSGTERVVGGQPYGQVCQGRCVGHHRLLVRHG
jgi:hypothetical protein